MREKRSDGRGDRIPSEGTERSRSNNVQALRCAGLYLPTGLRVRGKECLTRRRMPLEGETEARAICLQGSGPGGGRWSNPRQIWPAERSQACVSSAGAAATTHQQTA